MTRFRTLKFDEKSFFKTLLGFTPFCDYTPTSAIHADPSGVYTNHNTLNLSTRKKNHSKCDVIDGSIQNGSRHPILFRFVLDKNPGFKVFCKADTIHFKKINEIFLNTITFYLEDYQNEDVDFNRETFKL